MGNNKTLSVRINVGLSGSGKSTETNEFLSKNDKWVAVNRDSYRYMFRNAGWTENKIEDLISDQVDFAVIGALNKKLNVIIDATNLKESYIKHFIELVKYKANVEFRVFDVPLETCIERDKNRERSVGEAVIRKQYKDYKNLIDCYDFQNVSKLPDHEDRFIHAVQDKTLPEAVLFDFDGNISLMGKRSPYEWNKVDMDFPNDIVIDQMRLQKLAGRKILIVSGRDASCRNKCIEWLNFYNVPFDEIHMRPQNDNRKDYIIKKELYMENIKPNYNVIAVWDDRISVVKKCWYELGIFCFVTNQGLKEF